MLLAEHQAQQERQTAALIRERSGDEALPWVPFPSDLLPAPVADLVRSRAMAIGCDEAVVALPALAVAGAAIGNSRRVQIKPDWTEPSTLWTLAVVASGERKSPALDAALFPIYDLEDEARQAHELAHEEYEAALRTYNARSKKQRASDAPPEAPTRRRYRIGDVTVESVAPVHQENERGLLLARDELAGWLGSFNRYARGDADLQNWIELCGGRPITIDRKSSGAPVIDVRRPNVSVTGTIQPDVLRHHIGPLHITSGFLARILLAEPPRQPRRFPVATSSPEVNAGYAATVQRLYGLAGGEPVLLSDAAQGLFRSWVNENGQKMDHLDPADRLRASLSKVEGYAARFALAFHLVDTLGEEPPPVPEDTMLRAILLACWFRYEAARLYVRYGWRNVAETNRDTALAEQLPETFAAADVADLWEVGKRAAYKVVKRLEAQGLAEDAGHGSFRRLRPFHYRTAGELGDLFEFTPEGSP